MLDWMGTGCVLLDGTGWGRRGTGWGLDARSGAAAAVVGYGLDADWTRTGRGLAPDWRRTGCGQASGLAADWLRLDADWIGSIQSHPVY